MTALARVTSNCKRQIRPSSWRVPRQQNQNSLTLIHIWFWAPDVCLAPRQTGRLIVGRNITFDFCERDHILWKRNFSRRWAPTDWGHLEWTQSSKCFPISNLGRKQRQFPKRRALSEFQVLDEVQKFNSPKYFSPFFYYLVWVWLR
jgi:hypothetical protein